MPVVNYVGTPVGPDYLNEPFTITSTGSTSVAITKSGSPEDIILEYKKGTGDWTSYSIGSTIGLTDGESLNTNINLVLNNAKLGALIAKEYTKIK